MNQIPTIFAAGQRGSSPRSAGVALGSALACGAVLAAAAPALAGKAKTTRVSVSSSGAQANSPLVADSYDASISADGRFVAFKSYATDLVPGTTKGQIHVFVHDLRTGKTRRLGATSYNLAISISADGRFVAFDSFSTNLVPGDTNNDWDVFRRGPLRWR